MRPHDDSHLDPLGANKSRYACPVLYDLDPLERRLVDHLRRRRGLVRGESAGAVIGAGEIDPELAEEIAAAIDAMRIPEVGAEPLSAAPHPEPSWVEPSAVSEPPCRARVDALEHRLGELLTWARLEEHGRAQLDLRLAHVEAVLGALGFADSFETPAPPDAFDAAERWFACAELLIALWRRLF